jgi:nanoRNase/pAp phosphatase (c-di-AMP/oligoRNAs hydrolase)
MLNLLQITLGAGATQISATKVGIRQLMIQNNAAHSCRVGDSTVSTTKGIELVTQSGGGGGSINAGAFNINNVTNLNEWYIIGTQNDVIDVLYIV